LIKTEVTREELIDTLDSLNSSGIYIKELDTFITPTGEDALVVVVRDDSDFETAKRIATVIKTKRQFVISKRLDTRMSLINPIHYQSLQIE